MRKYLVSYNFKNSKGVGYGNMQIERKKKIKTFDDFLGLVHYIEEEKGSGSVVIMNIQKLPI